MLDAINNIENEIRSYFDTADFILQTCQQINKDLMGFSEHEVVWDTEKQTDRPLDVLIIQLQVIMESLSRSGHLSAFIYRVDLPELDYQKGLAESDWELLAFFIVRREAKKVWLRQKYSS